MCIDMQRGCAWMLDKYCRSEWVGTTSIWVVGNGYTAERYYIRYGNRVDDLE